MEGKSSRSGECRLTSGDGGTPRAGAARAAHPAAGAASCSGKLACMRACRSAAAPFGRQWGNRGRVWNDAMA